MAAEASAAPALTPRDLQGWYPGVHAAAVAAAVVWEAKAIPATTDTQVLCLVRGPSGVSKGGLVLDATYDTAPEKAVVYASLNALGIQTLDTI